jgi:hypothetical protein
MENHNLKITNLIPPQTQVVTKRIEAAETKLQEKLDFLIKLEDQVKEKERKILVSERQILEKMDTMIDRERHSR